MTRILIDEGSSIRRSVLARETLGAIQDLIHVDIKQGWLLVRDGETQVRIFNFIKETLEFALAIEPGAHITCNSTYIITHASTPTGTAIILFSKATKTASAISLTDVSGIDALFAFERSVLFKAKNSGLVTLNLSDRSLAVVACPLRQVFAIGDEFIGVTQRKKLYVHSSGKEVDLQLRNPIMYPVEDRKLLLIADANKLLLLNIDSMEIQSEVKLTYMPTALSYNTNNDSIIIGAKRGVVQVLIN